MIGNKSKPKRYIIRFNKNIPNSEYNFGAIKSRIKKVETRAATDKYRKIKTGDSLVFVCGKNKFERAVKSVKVFSNIDAMLKKYKIKEIMPNKKSRKELEEAYYSYPDYKEKIEKVGLVAWIL